MEKYYEEIKNKIIDNEVYRRVKDYSKESHTVITYFEIGKLLYVAGKHYGDNIIEKYAEKLVIEIGKKYNKRTLFRMKHCRHNYHGFTIQNYCQLKMLISYISI